MSNNTATIVACLALIWIACLASPAAAETEADVIKQVNVFREIKPSSDSAVLADYNKRMDTAWKFFDANKTLALPILSRVLDEETKLAKPNQLVLLDLAHFLARQNDPKQTQLALSAFLVIDPDTEIIKANFQDLFLLAHRLAAERDPRLLPQFDRLFLVGENKVAVPQHAMTLDSTLICVFLYGKYGDGAIPHLDAKLEHSSQRLRVMEILVWLGSYQSLPKIQSVMRIHKDFSTFARGTSFMMEVGGKEGRAAMLAIKPQDLDAETRKYLEQIQGAITASSYSAMEKRFAGMPGYKSIKDDELQTQLTKLYEDYGRNSVLHPLHVLKSALPTEVLIKVLARSRTRAFYRISNEALTDVKMTSAVINTLRYR